jgi:hypothetical protein
VRRSLHVRRREELGIDPHRDRRVGVTETAGERSSRDVIASGTQVQNRVAKVNRPHLGAPRSQRGVHDHSREDRARVSAAARMARTWAIVGTLTRARRTVGGDAERATFVGTARFTA